MTIPAGRRFWKMSGSGNDFLFFDAREQPPGDLETPERIDRLCARGTGIGADGLVFILTDDREAFRIRYFNRDGSLAELCGNASLCSTRLAVELGIGPATGFRFATDAGVIAARLSDGIPEIDLQPVRGLRPEAGIALAAGESRMGFADSGVPHLVVLVEELDSVDVVRRGRALRNHPSLPEGANVNFVTPVGQGRWRIRTYERGVEAETLACGTGSVATGVLLEAWRLSGARTSLQTRSGRILTATVSHHGSEVRPSLRGEGRIVFLGELGEV
ncbi:MAG TPA: diaminopimelate epimerase [Gemmatimonadaceae bacterium]|nr:diaminopimelate epimerase [Gemmatimonadaceae bacterium]